MRLSGIIAALVGIIVVFCAFSSLYTVDAGSRGIVLTGGKIVAVSEPGYHFKAPWQEVEDIEFRPIVTKFENEAFYSKDAQAANATISVTWEPLSGKAAEIYTNYKTLAGIEQRFSPMIRKEFKDVMGQYTAQTAIQERAKMGVEVEKAISGISYDVMRIVSVQVENIDFSDAYEAAVEKRMTLEVGIQSAQQQVLTEEKLADQARTKAKGEADSQLLAATAQAEAVKRRGEAEAAAIRAKGEAEADVLAAKAKQIRDNPLLIEQTKAERWSGTLPTTMLPNSAVPFIEAK